MNLIRSAQHPSLHRHPFEFVPRQSAAISQVSYSIQAHLYINTVQSRPISSHLAPALLEGRLYGHQTKMAGTRAVYHRRGTLGLSLVEPQHRRLFSETVRAKTVHNATREPQSGRGYDSVEDYAANTVILPKTTASCGPKFL